MFVEKPDWVLIVQIGEKVSGLSGIPPGIHVQFCGEQPINFNLLSSALGFGENPILDLKTTDGSLLKQDQTYQVQILNDGTARLIPDSLENSALLLFAAGLS